MGEVYRRLAYQLDRFWKSNDSTIVRLSRRSAGLKSGRYGQWHARSHYRVSMAETTTRRQGEIVQTLFRILDREPEGLQAKNAIARVEAELELTKFERATFPNNPDVVRFPKILRFATINSVKAGWLRKRSGTWTLTDEGKAALHALPDPEDLFNESRRLYKQWKASQPEDEDTSTADPASADEAPGTGDKTLIAATSLEEAEDAARQAILDHLGSMNPYDFQDLVAKLLEAMGYHLVWIAPKGKDAGLDLIAQSDPLGVQGPRIKGQVKRRPDNKTTEDEFRSFLSLIEPNDVGVFISLGGFSRDTQAAARRSSRRITLIDGEALLDLWVEHYDRIDEDGRGLLPIKPVYFLDINASAA